MGDTTQGRGSALISSYISVWPACAVMAFGSQSFIPRSQNSFSSENEKVTEAANEPTESPDAAAPAEKEKTQSAFV